MINIHEHQNTQKIAFDAQDDRYRKSARIEKIKASTKYMACGKVGDWFKDNLDRLRRMQEKNTEK